MFVAVEGPTGVGKTTLTSRLAALLDAQPVYDPFEANPFLRELYVGGTASHQHLALKTELTFLIDLVYVCRATAGNLTAQLEEVSGAQWIPIGDIAGLSTPAELPSLCC